jgi:hypothetical protein
MNRPSTLYSSCIQAFIAKSTMVTIAALIRMKTGIRTSRVIRLRNRDTRQLAAAITAVVASPMPRPLVALVVIAIAGHRPSIMAKTPLLFQRPSLTRVL